MLTPLSPVGSSECPQALVLDAMLVSADVKLCSSDIHKRIIHRDNKHLAGILQLGIINVAGNVSTGAGRACGEEASQRGSPPETIMGQRSY